MKHVNRILNFAAFVATCLLVVACSGIPGGNTGGGGGGTVFTISAKVSNLSGSGLVLQNNGSDNLAVSVDGTYPFAKKVAAYSVSVLTQPTNPQQTCSVTNGTGTATANVAVTISCATGTFTVGGQVTGLIGSGLVLQNNAADNLNVTTNGTFTFAKSANLNDAYNITVLVQPTKPSQVCTVASGTGTVSGNVGLPVVTCSIGTIPVGGSVSGLAGTGMVLQNNAGDNLTIAANGSFTFPTLLVSGQTYNATILTQPTTPPQSCSISNNTGTATAAVHTIQVTCQVIYEPIGGQVVGLSIPNGQTSQMVLQNNLGDNLPISGNGEFTFVTQIPYGNSYDVTVFVGPGTQDLGIVTWNWVGQATAPVTSVLIDCGHNDWSWMSGQKTANQFSAYTKPANPQITYLANTPGGRKYPSTWTDNGGHLWLFGGYGYVQSSDPVSQPTFVNDMWEYNGTFNYFGGISSYWNLHVPDPPPAPQPPPPPTGRWGAVTWTDSQNRLWLFGGQDGGLNFLNDLWYYNTATHAWTEVVTSASATSNGTYGTKGVASVNNLPGGRWGSTARIDANGNVWLFGGFGYDSASPTPGLLNDLWKFNVTNGTWTWVSGSNLTNQNGVYGTKGTAAASNVPGGRQAPVSWLDSAGNFWLFGGYNLSGTGDPNSFNDLWEYKGGNWTWVSGANTVNQIGTFGTQGVSAASNVPGSRWSPAAWTDAQGNLWLFGGQGYDVTGNGSLGDLWAYNPNAPANPLDPNPYLPASGQWVWVKGPSSTSLPGSYGVDPSTLSGQNRPHVTDFPGTRYGAGYWYAQSNSGDSFFYMFGGEGYDSTTTNGNGLLNDLWRYIPYP